LLKLVAAAFLLVVLIAVGVGILPPQASGPTIKGNIPQEDVAAVDRFLRKRMASTLLPDYSLASFRELPARISYRLHFRIYEIDASDSNSARVLIPWPGPLTKAIARVQLVKSTNGWQWSPNPIIDITNLSNLKPTSRQ